MIVGYPKECDSKRVAVRLSASDWIGFHVSYWNVSNYGVLSLSIYHSPNADDWGTSYRHYSPCQWREASDEPDRLKEVFGE